MLYAQLLYWNIDQTLVNLLIYFTTITKQVIQLNHARWHRICVRMVFVNLLHSLLNVKIGGLDCHVTTTEYISHVH